MIVMQASYSPKLVERAGVHKLSFIKLKVPCLPALHRFYAGDADQSQG